MKTFFTLFSLLSFCSYAQFVSISDTSFRNYLKLNYPSCFNAESLLDTTCSLITEETHVTLQLFDQTTTGPYRKIEGLQYFKSLYSLGFAFLDIEVGKLPASLKKIRQYLTRAQYLAPIPDGLTHLELHQTVAVFPFPTLPSKLSFLYIEATDLTVLPQLPLGLDSIYCAGNPLLTALPDLPDSLTKIVARGNALTALPKMPYYIEHVEADLNCFDPIPKPPLSTFLKYFKVTPNNPECVVTGLEHSSQDSGLQLYPVLVKDILNFAGMEGEKNIKIHTGEGILIKEYNTAANQLDLNDLTSGLYHILISDQTKILAPQKIIKE